MKRVFIDTGACSLCKGCMEIAPEVFFFSEELGIMLTAELSVDQEALVAEAKKNCPEDCIHWER